MQNIIDTFQAQGTRKEQQDSFGQWIDADAVFLAHGGSLVIVADGMGGLEQGKQASDLAVKSFIHAYKSKLPDESIDAALMRSVIHCNKAVYDFSSAQGLDGKLGTTLVAAVNFLDMVHWISVGDSRIYHIKPESIICLTKDHNYENDLLVLVEKGELTIEDVQNNSQKAALTSYIGDKEIAKIDFSKEPLKCSHGEKILLCSDGLYAHISDLEFLQTVNACKINFAEALISFKLTKQLKKQDNLTASVISINTGLNSAPTFAPKILIIWFLILAMCSSGIMFFMQLGPFAPVSVDGNDASVAGYSMLKPIVISEEGREELLEAAPEQLPLTSSSAASILDEVVSPIDNPSEVIQVTDVSTETSETAKEKSLDVNESKVSIVTGDSIRSQEGEAPYTVYPSVNEVEIKSAPNPINKNKITIPEALIPDSPSDTDVAPLLQSSKASTKQPSAKPTIQNELESQSTRSQSLIILEKKEESIRTCIETAAGEVCRDVPLKKPAVPDLPNKNIAEAKNNTPAAEVTKCKPKGSPKDSSRAMIPECL